MKKEIKKRRKFNYKKLIRITVSVLVILGVLTVINVLGTDVSMAVADEYSQVKQVEYTIEDADYGYKIKNTNKNFRILQLTDIHIGGGILSVNNDKMAITAVAAVVKAANPDFIIVTGDISYPVPFQAGTINNMVAARIFARLMDNLGIPWTITYGNHDTEVYSMYGRAELTEFYQSRTFCYFKRGPENITGYGNQIFSLYNQDGSFNTAIVLIDSNDYIKGGNGITDYDIIHDDQLEWYKEEILKLSDDVGKLVPSLMFFHIPIQEYAEAYDLYEAGDPSVEYRYGKRREPVASSAEPCNTFETILELGSTKAIFCGHDHVNDYSLVYKGITLTYGKSIDYLAYAWSGIIRQTEQRGGTIIDISEDASFHISTIKYSDI
ncbi:MAG: metallophosphoesterase [Clostridia bacterium]